MKRTLPSIQRFIAATLFAAASVAAPSAAQEFGYGLVKHGGSLAIGDPWIDQRFTTDNTIQEVSNRVDPINGRNAGVRVEFGGSLLFANLLRRGNVQVSALHEGVGPEPSQREGRGACSFEQRPGPENRISVYCHSGRTESLSNRDFLVFAIRPTDDRRGQTAFALLDRPSEPSYVAGSRSRFGRGSMRVTRSGPGTYSIDLDPIATTGSTVQVTAYGRDRRYCNVRSWWEGTVRVDCYDIAGRPADAAASVLVISRDYPGISFLWSEDAGGGTVPAPYRHSAISQSVVRVAEGEYDVTLGPGANTGGHAQVTAYGSNAYCYLSTSAAARQIWARDRVRVKCTLDGRPVDSRFTVMAVAKQRILVDDLAFGGTTPTRAMICPTTATTDGDRDFGGVFGGNGASVQTDVNLRVSAGTDLFMDVTFTANERNGGDTRVSESTSIRLFSAPAGMVIPATPIPSSARLGPVESHGPSGSGDDLIRINPSNGLVRMIEMVGDTGGHDISEDSNCSDDTRLQRLVLNPIRVPLRPR